MAGQYGWIDTRHPVHAAWTKGAAVAGGEFDPGTGMRQTAEVGAWERNERRLRGGDDALDELAFFDWERGPRGQTRYESRKAQATYINFPELLVGTVVGHLSRRQPMPGKGLTFGGLGDVRSDAERNPSEPTKAEMLWFNCDGVGNDGSQWPNFWAMQARLAMATGHRWIFVESSARAPANGVVPTDADEFAGRRPYLVAFGPQKVINWHYEEGRLAFAVLRVPDRRPRLVDGRMMGNDSTMGYLLLVRRGWTGFGEAFQEGGWWLFDHSREMVEGKHRDWASTNGEIPLVQLFYERDEGTEQRPAVSRPATTELGQVAVSYMNLSSAADFDAWDSGSSVQVILGADPPGFNLLLEKLAEGSRWVPLPSPQANSDKIPQIHDGSTGAVIADVFDKRLAQKFEEARHLALMEPSGTPDSSGESKRAGFDESKAPRIARFASEIEQAMNSVLYFVERRWGVQAPKAYCEWPRDFDLASLTDDISEVFDLQAKSGLESPTLTAKLMTQAVVEKRLVTESEELELIEAEYTVAAFEKQAQQRQDAAFSGAVNGGDRPGGQ